MNAGIFSTHDTSNYSNNYQMHMEAVTLGQIDFIEKFNWLRWHWANSEYVPKIKFFLVQTKLIHRKMPFSLSGWLAKVGKSKRTGK